MTEDRGFIPKPARGWLHSDQLITKEGISYDVEYIGCVEVLTSMKSLDFETRSQVAKECIWRACEESGARGRRGAAGAAGAAGGASAGGAGVAARLTVSSAGLRLDARDGAPLAHHDMPRISFASGGDSDTSDFVAYVAKNLQNWRACYVLHCTKDAQELIATIGQAFELRFKEFLTKPQDVARALGAGPGANGRPDGDYYNDMPGKAPPPPSLPEWGGGGGGRRGGAAPPQYENQEPPPPTPLTAALPLPTPSRPPDADAFDMRPFSGEGEEAEGAEETRAEEAEAGLEAEEWFHGPLGRAEAERLLGAEGAFLVRRSRGGRLVLSGARGAGGARKHHLLLVDPGGRVRTRDRAFRSVAHLVRFHARGRLPILSADSALLLLTPVPRAAPPPAPAPAPAPARSF